MAYGRSKMLLNGDVVRSAVSPLRSLERDPTDARHELQKLRATNARFVRELAALKEREAQAVRDDLQARIVRRRLLPPGHACARASSASMPADRRRATGAGLPRRRR